MPVAFAQLLIDACYILLADLTGVAGVAVLLGMLGLAYFTGARISAKVLNRGLGK